jgi:hypothetical protein
VTNNEAVAALTMLTVGTWTDGEDLAGAIMDITDGHCEILIEYVFGEDGDPCWFANFRWDGMELPRSETDIGSRWNMTEALVLGLGRLTTWLEAPSDPV